MTDPTPEAAAFADFLGRQLGSDQTSSSAPSDTNEASSSDILAAIRDLVAQENKTQDPEAMFAAFMDAALRKGKKTL